MENSKFESRGVRINSFLPWDCKSQFRCSFGGHMLMAYSMNNHIFIYDYTANSILFTLAHSTSSITALAWNHNATTILAASDTAGNLFLTHMQRLDTHTLKVEKKPLSLDWHSFKDWVVMGCEQAIYIVESSSAQVIYSYNTELSSLYITFDSHYTERILFLDCVRSSIGILKNFKDAEINILELQDENISSFLISPSIKDAILVARGNSVSLYHSEGVYIGECLTCEDDILYLLGSYAVNERLIILSRTAVYLYELDTDISYTNYEYRLISCLKLQHSILTADIYKFIGGSPVLTIISEDSLMMYELSKNTWKLNYLHSISVPRGMVSYNEHTSNIYLGYGNTITVLNSYLTPIDKLEIPEDALYIASNASYVYILTSAYTLLELELTTGEITEIKRYTHKVNGICIDWSGEYLAISIEHDLEILRLKHKDKEIEDIYSYDLTVGEVIYSMKWETSSSVLIYATETGLYKLLISLEYTEKDDELAFEFSTLMSLHIKVKEIIGCMKDLYLLDESGIYYTVYMDTETTIRLSDPIPLVAEWTKVITADIHKIDQDKIRKQIYVMDNNGIYYLARKNSELPSKTAPVLRGNQERTRITKYMEEEMKSSSPHFSKKIINLDNSLVKSNEFNWMDSDIMKDFENAGIHDKLLILARLYGNVCEYRFWELAFYFVGSLKNGRITPLGESAASTCTSSTFRNSQAETNLRKSRNGLNTKSSNSIRRKSSTPDSLITANHTEKEAKEVNRSNSKPRRLRGSCENLLKLAVDTSNLLSISIEVHKEEILSYLYYSQDSQKLSRIEKDLQNLIGGTYTRRNSSFIDKQLSSVLNNSTHLKQFPKPNTLKFISGIPKGKVFEEILRENEMQACFLLQVLGYCEEAAIISKISLNQVQSLKIYLKWAIELIYKGFPLQAIELLLSSGQYHRVLQVLTKEKMYEQAMLFYLYCQTKGVIIQNQWAYHISAIFDVPLWEEISTMFNTISEFNFTPERMERSVVYLRQEYANCDS